MTGLLPALEGPSDQNNRQGCQDGVEQTSYGQTTRPGKVPQPPVGRVNVVPSHTPQTPPPPLHHLRCLAVHGADYPEPRDWLS